MKKLKFSLLTNNKLTIDTETTYYITNNIIKFKIDKTLYEYDLLSSILSKKENDTIITINPSEKVIIINLLKEAYKFDMFIDNINVLKGNNSVQMEYSIAESDTLENIIKINIIW